ncbi:hypothetical protein CALCODRAFT_59662 [Calocera cornea HHB12733]|uniref:Uncharacterized protein n=1 Tax=Calocera cornea HHB12733 TaxID=1353952 RepID=A0A165IXF3_9BASI|nr:hypothetical protein CALCODRAFT_59662 [Calocera cornea HHB12733]
MSNERSCPCPPFTPSPEDARTIHEPLAGFANPKQRRWARGNPPATSHQPPAAPADNWVQYHTTTAGAGAGLRFPPPPRPREPSTRKGHPLRLTGSPVYIASIADSGLSARHQGPAGRGARSPEGRKSGKGPKLRKAAREYALPGAPAPGALHQGRRLRPLSS